MKKELLIASALVSTMGVASVAEAVTASTSGSMTTGIRGTNLDSSASDTTARVTTASFSVSLSETTDGGVGIASSFMLANESTTGLQTGGLTLTFTDGSKLDVMTAGNAAASHDVSVPAGAGEASITVTTTNNASNSLDFFGAATGIGVEWHSAADFMMDGLKIGVSYSADNGAAATSSAKLESSWGVGATYVTDAGDTALTIGMGLADSTYKVSGTQPSAEENGYHVGISAVTGDLTIAGGFADGDDLQTGTTVTQEEMTQEVSKVGIKYVSGDLTMSVGYATGSANDGSFGSGATASDSLDTTAAGIAYAVASGVTANLGYKSIDSSDEGSSETSGGSSWYIGANLAF